MTQNNLRVLRGVLIFLIVAHALCSCLSCAQKSYSEWDKDTAQAIEVVENVGGISWTTLLFSAVQIVLLLCNRDVLQVFTAVFASGQSLISPLRVYLLNLINENIYFVWDNGILPHKTYDLIITPVGYAAAGLSAAMLICSVVYAVQCAKERQPAEEIRQAEERDEVVV